MLYLIRTTKTDHLDMAVGIIKNGELTYSGGYGYSNLDYDIPISDSSIFYIGSMAKQFTAAALLILENEGKLDFNKEVKYYLSDFPEYEWPITIEHLIHHTSGIRETNSLQLFQGIDLNFEQVFDTDDLFELVKNQRELNFQPGTEYRYSSGGYVVLAKVIEGISGMSFRKFLKKNIFDPLGMHHTFVSDNHNEIIKNRVDSYWPQPDGIWARRSLIFDAYGDGGIMTCVKDLAKWDEAFYKNLLAIPDFSRKMYTKGVLNNHEEIGYVRALEVWKYKGQQVVTHSGGMLGFRADMVRFPAHRFTVIALGNSAFMNPTGKALEVAGIFLSGYFQKGNYYSGGETEVFAIENPESLEVLSGYYWTDDLNYYRRVTFQNDSLFFDDGNSASKSYLIPLAENEFAIRGAEPATTLVFGSDKSKEAGMTMRENKLERAYRKFDPTLPMSIEELRRYEGVYFSRELQAAYHFYIDENKLQLKINNNDPIRLFPTEPRGKVYVVWNGKRMVWIGFGEIKFDVTNSGKIRGFNIGDQRVKGVHFEKQS